MKFFNTKKKEAKPEFKYIDAEQAALLSRHSHAQQSMKEKLELEKQIKFNRVWWREHIAFFIARATKKGLYGVKTRSTENRALDQEIIKLYTNLGYIVQPFTNENGNPGVTVMWGQPSDMDPFTVDVPILIPTQFDQAGFDSFWMDYVMSHEIEVQQ